LTFAVEDIYALPDSYNSAFNYALEIGDFQAMSVKERREYVTVLHGVLMPSGTCIVLCKKYPPFTPGSPGAEEKVFVQVLLRLFRCRKNRAGVDVS
jgi:hypothetical protein